MIRVGVTGTDTGVGKTVVTCALAAALRARGLRVAAMKPVETGVSFDDPARDGARLARAAGCDRPLSATAPIVFARPLSPLAAARALGRSVDLGALDAAINAAARDADALIVEGAGGLLVPVTVAVSFADLFARWSLDLVIVAANRLGVINHTLLTVQAAHAAGLVVRAVVLSSTTSAPSDPSTASNAAQLAELLATRFPGAGPPVVELPWLRTVDDLPTLAEHAERCGLADLVVRGTASKDVT